MTKQLIAERAELWAKALELNNGKEARGDFRAGKFRCCLCVAAEVAAEQTGHVEWRRNVGGLPSNEVAHWFGWDETNPKLVGTNSTALNDKSQLSHKEIAALVREQFTK